MATTPRPTNVLPARAAPTVVLGDSLFFFRRNFVFIHPSTHVYGRSMFILHPAFSSSEACAEDSCSRIVSDYSLDYLPDDFCASILRRHDHDSRLRHDLRPIRAPGNVPLQTHLPVSNPVLVP